MSDQISSDALNVLKNEDDVFSRRVCSRRGVSAPVLFLLLLMPMLQLKLALL